MSVNSFKHIVCLFKFSHFVLSSPAPSPPRNLKATVKSAWQIDLSWNEPEKKNGEIWRYEIDVKESLSNVITLHTTENTNFEAKNLKPYTNYTFSVKARGSGGYSEKVTTKAATFTSSE